MLPSTHSTVTKMRALSPEQQLRRAISEGHVLEPVATNGPYRCTLCDKELKTKETMKTHLASMKHKDKELSKDVEKLSISADKDEEETSTTPKDSRTQDGTKTPPELQPYSVTSNPRGHVHVFNYFVPEPQDEKYPSTRLGAEHVSGYLRPRNGAEYDFVNLSSIFDKMGYEVFPHKNLTAQDTEKKLDEIRNSEGLNQVDSLIIFFLSHGRKPYSFLANDGKEVDLRDIRKKFTNSACPAMKKKPKIIFTNFCRGKDDEAPETDDIVDVARDLVTIYASAGEICARRLPDKGTIFVLALCKVLKKYAGTLNLREIYKMLDTEVKKRKGTQPSWEDFRFRKFHFIPPQSRT